MKHSGHWIFWPWTTFVLGQKINWDFLILEETKNARLSIFFAKNHGFLPSTYNFLQLLEQFLPSSTWCKNNNRGYPCSFLQKNIFLTFFRRFSAFKKPFLCNTRQFPESFHLLVDVHFINGHYVHICSHKSTLPGPFFQEQVCFESHVYTTRMIIFLVNSGWDL